MAAKKGIKKPGAPMSILHCPFSTGIGTPYGAAVFAGNVRGMTFITRMPEVLAGGPSYALLHAYRFRGGRIGACCIAGTADNDTVEVIIARA